MRISSTIYIVFTFFFIGIIISHTPLIGFFEEEILPLLISDDFEDEDAEIWTPNPSSTWEIKGEEGSFVYRLMTPGEPGKIRAPFSWSILKDYDVSVFKFQGKLRCDEDVSNPYRDVVILFNFQDPEHFYYVHFSAISDEVHNIIGLVNGKDRVKINLEPPGESKAMLADNLFHDFRVTYNARDGEIQAYLDDMDTPILTALDRTLNHGAVGVGSFDDTASFDEIRLWGNIYNKDKEGNSHD